MNKKELVKAIARKSGAPIQQTRNLLQTTLEVMAEQFQREGNITLLGFGTFRIHRRNAHDGYNPLTRKPIRIPASQTVKFKLSSKIRLNKKK